VRLVLDTNVVVSALIWGSPPFKLIEAAAAQGIHIVPVADAIKRIEVAT